MSTPEIVLHVSEIMPTADLEIWIMPISMLMDQPSPQLLGMADEGGNVLIVPKTVVGRHVCEALGFEMPPAGSSMYVAGSDHESVCGTAFAAGLSCGSL